MLFGTKHIRIRRAEVLACQRALQEPACAKDGDARRRRKGCVRGGRARTRVGGVAACCACMCRLPAGGRHRFGAAAAANYGAGPARRSAVPETHSIPAHRHLLTY
eukprot:364631-Chlamydomonas_euryale.AAC.28